MARAIVTLLISCCIADALDARHWSCQQLDDTDVAVRRCRFDISSILSSLSLPTLAPQCITTLQFQLLPPDELIDQVNDLAMTQTLNQSQLQLTSNRFLQLFPAVYRGIAWIDVCTNGADCLIAGYEYRVSLAFDHVLPGNDTGLNPIGGGGGERFRRDTVLTTCPNTLSLGLMGPLKPPTPLNNYSFELDAHNNVAITTTFVPNHGMTKLSMTIFETECFPCPNICPKFCTLASQRTHTVSSPSGVLYRAALANLLPLTNYSMLIASDGSTGLWRHTVTFHTHAVTPTQTLQIHYMQDGADTLLFQLETPCDTTCLLRAGPGHAAVQDLEFVRWLTQDGEVIANITQPLHHGPLASLSSTHFKLLATFSDLSPLNCYTASFALQSSAGIGPVTTAKTCTRLATSYNLVSSSKTVKQDEPVINLSWKMQPSLACEWQLLMTADDPIIFIRDPYALQRVFYLDTTCRDDFCEARLNLSDASSNMRASPFYKSTLLCTPVLSSRTTLQFDVGLIALNWPTSTSMSSTTGNGPAYPTQSMSTIADTTQAPTSDQPTSDYISSTDPDLDTTSNAGVPKDKKVMSTLPFVDEDTAIDNSRLSPSANSSNNKTSSFTPLLAALATLIALLVLVILFLVRRLRNRVATPRDPILPAVDAWELPRTQLTLGDRIGAGAFGTVIRATGKGVHPDLEANAELAVKVCSAQASDVDQRLAFVEEMQVCKQLAVPGHPNIIRLYGVCTVDEPLMLVMQYAPLGDVRLLMEASKTSSDPPVVFSPELLETLVIELCSAIAYLHQQQVVHGDVSARNCLLSADHHLLLCDFGMAKMVHLTGGYYHRDQVDCLPFRWMAPESLRSGLFSSSSDIWGLGVTMWELYAEGRLPWDRYTNDKVLREVINGATLIPPPTTPRHMQAIMRECWMFQANRRPSANKLLAQLDGMTHSDICSIAPSFGSQGYFEEATFSPGSNPHTSPSPSLGSPSRYHSPSSAPSRSSKSSFAQLRSVASSRHASTERTRRDYASLAGPKTPASPDQLAAPMQSIPKPRRRRANTEPTRPSASALANIRPRMTSPPSRPAARVIQLAPPSLDIFDSPSPRLSRRGMSDPTRDSTDPMLRLLNGSVTQESHL
eukprot:m.214269 g.214269  ORF g.214269 m.214269 type:complete len:1120 (+) comp17191_c0_seq2:127-3486(+)